MTLADLETLQAKARQWLGEERGWDLWFALFSCDGFTTELQARATQDSHLLLVTPTAVVGKAA
jgi:hypothetical protein